MDRRVFLSKAGAGVGALASLRIDNTGLGQSVAQQATVTSHWMDLPSGETRATYLRIKAYLDAIRSIDSHEHLRPFDDLPCLVETEWGRGANLYGQWASSYVMDRIGKLTPWSAKTPFREWWKQARSDFDNVRATSFYRTMWLAFLDLYDLDFDHITDDEAAGLDRRIFENYRDQTWLYDVIQKRSGIEVMITDPHWKRLSFQADYPFEFITFNVTNLLCGFHSSEYAEGNFFKSSDPTFDSPYLYASRRGLPLNSFDDYLELLSEMFVEAVKGDCVCLKSTAAYIRALYFENVSKDRAARAFGRKRSEMAPDEAKAFEDFIMWRLAELSARYELPFQIHTGDAKIQGSNPMLLVNLIEANPDTRFELFHGGYPWVQETGAIGMKYGSHVWINGVWLQAISYSMAKHAFNEWLEVMPSNRITWGGDEHTAEGIYGETELNRHCWAEVLAGKISRGELAEDDARRIGSQILRDNALDLYPLLKPKMARRQAQSSIIPGAKAPA
jgi:hypothetical protein